ncbi:glycosyltransferase family 2 protein [Mucilaginibacter sp.]|uniref:glycosyltransferase family 2 protein n=1 Tax=Mucilaginibacter sp. TaxID=1882438 RepID=UPI0035BBC6F6
MVHNKKISIIIPFYNGETYLPRLLNSISVAIGNCQPLTLNFELIVFIDSMETSVDILTSLISEYTYRKDFNEIIIQKNKINIGVAATRNAAISIAKGSHLHIIDQDDAVSETFYLEAAPLLVDNCFILTNGIVYYSDTKYNSHKLYYLTPQLSIAGLLKGDYIRSPGQVIFSRGLLGEKFFPEPKTFKGADDRFFWIKLFIENGKKIKPFYIKNSNYVAFIHNHNYSADGENLKRSTLENWEILKNETDLRLYERTVAQDILRVKFALREDMQIINKITGLWRNVIYFLEPNKLIRFVAKRKK